MMVLMVEYSSDICLEMRNILSLLNVTTASGKLMFNKFG